jgi:hypothetical protein
VSSQQRGPSTRIANVAFFQKSTLASLQLRPIQLKPEQIRRTEHWDEPDRSGTELFREKSRPKRKATGTGPLVAAVAENGRADFTGEHWAGRRRTIEDGPEIDGARDRFRTRRAANRAKQEQEAGGGGPDGAEPSGAEVGRPPAVAVEAGPRGIDSRGEQVGADQGSGASRSGRARDRSGRGRGGGSERGRPGRIRRRPRRPIPVTPVTGGDGACRNESGRDEAGGDEAGDDGNEAGGNAEIGSETSRVARAKKKTYSSDTML